MEAYTDYVVKYPIETLVGLFIAGFVLNYFYLAIKSRRLEAKNQKLSRAGSKLKRKTNTLKYKLRNLRQYHHLTRRRHNASVTRMSVKSQVQKQREDDLIDVLKDRSRKIAVLKKR